MNYLAHALSDLDNPYFVAGTSLPDWLNVVDRKVRVRSKLAAPFVTHEDEKIRTIAEGIMRHHDDDDWFHGSPVFQAMNMRFSVQIRETLQDPAGLRAGFLGHILVEILLDSILEEEDPGLLERYYASVDVVDVTTVQRAVNLISRKPTEQLVGIVPKMIQARFLYDYADDKKLLTRLNQIMRRVKLPELSDAMLDFLPVARSEVRAAKNDLVGRTE